MKSSLILSQLTPFLINQIEICQTKSWDLAQLLIQKRMKKFKAFLVVVHRRTKRFGKIFLHLCQRGKDGETGRKKKLKFFDFSRENCLLGEDF